MYKFIIEIYVYMGVVCVLHDFFKKFA